MLWSFAGVTPESRHPLLRNRNTHQSGPALFVQILDLARRVTPDNSDVFCLQRWAAKPFCVIDTDFNDAMTSVLSDIVNAVREEYRVHGIDPAGLNIVFDRGGYSG